MSDYKIMFQTLYDTLKETVVRLEPLSDDLHDSMRDKKMLLIGSQGLMKSSYNGIQELRQTLKDYTMARIESESDFADEEEDEALESLINDYENEPDDFAQVNTTTMAMHLWEAQFRQDVMALLTKLEVTNYADAAGDKIILAKYEDYDDMMAAAARLWGHLRLTNAAE